MCALNVNLLSRTTPRILSVSFVWTLESLRWKSYWYEDGPIAIVLVDFQKAFDCVSHNVLLRKLESNFGINGVLLDWLRSYLDNRKQCTVLNGIASDLNTVKAGIPQGSVLGSTLFSFYTSDLPEATTTATTYMYANNTTLYYIGDSIDTVITERVWRLLI